VAEDLLEVVAAAPTKAEAADKTRGVVDK